MVERKDVHAALEARKELGPAYEDEIVDSLLAKLEARMPAQRPAPQGSMTPLAITSIVLGVGATAIAVPQDPWLAAVAWIAIVLVNAVVALRHRL